MYIFCSPIFISDRDFLKAQTPANGGRLFIAEKFTVWTAVLFRRGREMRGFPPQPEQGHTWGRTRPVPRESGNNSGR